MQEKLQQNTFLSLIKPSRCQPFNFPFLASHWHYENQLTHLSLQELIGNHQEARARETDQPYLRCKDS